MTGVALADNKLVEVYHRYIGEPESKRDVYGYWLFLLGTIIGLVGVLVYLFEQALAPGDLAFREIAIILSAIGLPLVLLGIIVLLPVRRRGMQASVIGLLVAFLAVGLFYLVYPDTWYITEPDYSAAVIGIYTIGIAILAGVAALVPVITGEKGLLVKPELGIGKDLPPILIGDANRDAIMAIYETPTHDWAWRIIQRDVIGESAQLSQSDTDARLQIEEVQSVIGEAGLLEITTAAFRLYHTQDDGWRWSLVRDDGSVIATNDEVYPTRTEVEDSVSFLKEESPNAGMIDIRSAAFNIHRQGDRWQWRLLDNHRNVLALSADEFSEENDAQIDADRFKESIVEARLLAVEQIAIELVESDGTDSTAWSWRYVTNDDEILLTSTETFESRRGAEDNAIDIARQAKDATIIERGTPGYEVYQSNGTWEWRLRDENAMIIAQMDGETETAKNAQEAASVTRDVVANADPLEYVGADFEIFEQNTEWHWRLVGVDRTVVAESTSGYSDRDAAETAVDSVREKIREAELIEFDQAAFQQYETEGEWRWRLIDEDGQVMADSGEEYGSKNESMQAMRTLKENAPSAEVLEIETAAFEIYRHESNVYAWRLIDETGKLIASSAQTVGTREEALETVDFVLSNTDDASTRVMEHAAFQIFQHDEEWQWRLIHPSGSILAIGEETYPTRDEVTQGIQHVQTAGANGEIDTLGPVSVFLSENGNWHWRFIDQDDSVVAQGELMYDTRTAAIADAENATEAGVDAPVFELGEGVVWIDQRDAGWDWKLYDASRSVIATGDGTYEEQSSVQSVIETIQARVDEAKWVSFEGASFELYRDGENGFRWRLLDEHENVMATSGVAFDQRDDAEAVIESVRTVVPQASILEIDESTFELHARNDGWVWRLVNENGSPVAESVTALPTRKAAREEMNEVKRFVPSGPITVTW